MPGVDYYFLKRSLEGPADACGDGGVVLEKDGFLFWALVDVLGHGREAHKVALRAEAFLLENFSLELVDIMKGLHEHLRGDRGAVAAMGRLETETGKLSYTGMGNINTKLHGANRHHFTPRDGIIGYNISTPVQYEVIMAPGNLLVATSDGVREHFIPEDYPDLFKGSAGQVAARIMSNLSKGEDDASCIVVRYGK